MDKNYKWKVLFVISLFAFAVWKCYPLDQKIKLGLDLKGGMQLVLQVDMSKVPENQREDVTERVAEVVRNRIDEFGVVEPEISTQGKDQVVVKLPGITDRERAIQIAGRTAHLEFRLVSDDVNLSSQLEKGVAPKGFEVKKVKDATMEDQLLVSKEAVLTGEKLTNAAVGFDQYGKPMVELSFDKDGAKIFDRVTFQNIGRRLAIVLDGVVHSAPVIRDRISGGNAQISGGFTNEEAKDLALVLRAGALPAPVKIIEERTIGPSLGRDSIEKSVKAGLFGLAAVVIFMCVYYQLCGLIASVGLLFYTVVVLGAMGMMGATLTLPGIAGFILSIGMAVDANVLIFERIREEVALGKGSRAAVSAGYHKAFSAIFDSNITTLITSAILFIFGTGPVQGFAVTLSIGIVASMISALVVTRVIFDFLTSRNANLKLSMLNFFKKTNIPFLKGRFFAYGFSIIVLGIGIASYVMRSSESYGVEFTGGTFTQLKFEQTVDVAKFREELAKENVGSFSLQQVGIDAENVYAVKFAGHEVVPVENAAKRLAVPYQVQRVDLVGPSVSADLQKKAMLAVLWSCIGILIYVAFRFKFQFSFGAVVALVHDAIFAFGIFMLTGHEINLPIVAALLTIIGFSVNDTIVTFDRLRDNMKIMRKESFMEIVNLSVNQTLGRTILTTATVVFSTSCIYFFGGSEIKDFAFILLLGFGVGIYSTVFVASAIVVDIYRKPAPIKLAK
mgnify:CR=1 FL=1